MCSTQRSLKLELSNLAGHDWVTILNCIVMGKYHCNLSLLSSRFFMFCVSMFSILPAGNRKNCIVMGKSHSNFSLLSSYFFSCFVFGCFRPEMTG